MTFTSKNQRDIDAVNATFHSADIVGLRAIAVLNERRDKNRSALVGDGADPDEVLRQRLDGIRTVFLNRCAPAGTAGKRLEKIEDPFTTTADLDARTFIPLLKAAIWELWRDYHEWPDGHMLRERLATWLHVTAHDAAAVIYAVAADPYFQQTWGSAHPDPNAAVKLPDDRRWFISDINEAYFQEELYQWRILLGDDGAIFRVPFTLFASEHPSFWRIPA